MAESLRVGITKTKREWKTIDKRIKELSTNRSLSDSERYGSYLNTKISTMINDFKNCPDCVQQLFPKRNPERKITISPVWHQSLIEISESLGVPISTIIDRIILTPLLIEK